MNLRVIDLDGVQHVKWIETHPLAYERVGVGGPITITYLRSKPDTLFVSGDEPSIDKAVNFA